MKKEVVNVNGKYAARFKRWYHIRWRYIGNAHTWNESEIKGSSLILTNDYYKAEKKLNDWFPKITKN